MLGVLIRTEAMLQAVIELNGASPALLGVVGNNKKIALTRKADNLRQGVDVIVNYLSEISVHLSIISQSVESLSSQLTTEETDAVERLEVSVSELPIKYSTKRTACVRLKGIWIENSVRLKSDVDKVIVELRNPKVADKGAVLKLCDMVTSSMNEITLRVRDSAKDVIIFAAYSFSFPLDNLSSCASSVNATIEEIKISLPN